MPPEDPPRCACESSAVWDAVFQVAYSFKDAVALVEVAHKHNVDFPAVRVFVKAAAGANIGVGRPSAGTHSTTAMPCALLSLALHAPPVFSAH